MMCMLNGQHSSVSAPSLGRIVWLLISLAHCFLVSSPNNFQDYKLWEHERHLCLWFKTQKLRPRATSSSGDHGHFHSPVPASVNWQQWTLHARIGLTENRVHQNVYWHCRRREWEPRGCELHFSSLPFFPEFLLLLSFRVMGRLTGPDLYIYYWEQMWKPFLKCSCPSIDLLLPVHLPTWSWAQQKRKRINTWFR